MELTLDMVDYQQEELCLVSPFKATCVRSTILLRILATALIGLTLQRFTLWSGIANLREGILKSFLHLSPS